MLSCSPTVASAAAGAASAAPTLTQDSLDLTGGMLNVGVDFGVASAGSHPLVQGSDGSYYALVATNEGPQFIKLADIGSATDVHPASAVDLSNSG
jgi:hypothetical protein